jgi:hypothetical protein
MMMKIFMLCFAAFITSASAAAQVPRDIAFCIADVKYDGKNLKILEFGDCAESMFTGYNALYGNGAIWHSFWKYLAAFKAPLWIVGGDQKFIGLSSFKKFGGKRVLSMNALSLAIDKDKNQRNSSEPAGIVFIKSAYSQPSMALLKRKFPSLIFINKKVRRHVIDKYRTNLLFQNDNDLKKFRPGCKVCKKKYTPGLAQSIINELKANTYVIKPTHGSCGKGVIFVKKHELDGMLRALLENRSDLRIMRNKDVRMFDFWLIDKTPHFLVEEYAPSKILTIAGKPYDPTMRLIFAMNSTGEKIKIDILGAYWKLPGKSLAAKNTLTQKHRSDVHSSAPVNSVRVCSDDLEHVSEIFKPMMEKIYRRMLKS